jgi:tetratricopeptide (TPR) repeat protein
VQRFILLLIITISFQFSFAQNIEKIKKELKENPKTRMQNAVILREHYADFSTDSLFSLGTYLLQEGISEDNTPMMMYAKIILSSYYNQHGKTEISVRYLNECIGYYQKKGDLERLADAQNLLGIAHIYNGEYHKAANAFIKSIKNAEKLGENNESFIAQLNLSEVYIREEKLDLAENEVLEFIEKCKKLKSNNGLKKGYDFLAKIYTLRNNMDLAIYYYEKALKLAMKSDAIIGRASSYNNIAIAHFETGKLDLSLEYFKKALDLRIKLNSPVGISESYYNLGDWNFYQEYYDEAIKYYQTAFEVAKKNNLNREVADALDKISMCYEEKGDFKKALEYSRKYQEIEADNYKRNQGNEIDLQRTAYEIEREEEILNQKKREDKIQNKVLLEQDRGRIIVITFTIIVALMIVFYFLQTSRKNKQNAKIVSEKEFEETISKLKTKNEQWQTLENFILEKEKANIHAQTFVIEKQHLTSIGHFQSLKLKNENLLFWETPLSELENYILKNHLIESIGDETNEGKITEIIQNQTLIDQSNLSFVFISITDNEILIDGKNGLLIQNSNKMSFLSEIETSISNPTILISERLKNELLATENWDKFLSQIDMLPRMSNEMGIETMYSCWAEMLSEHKFGILFFFENEQA